MMKISIDNLRIFFRWGSRGSGRASSLVAAVVLCLAGRLPAQILYSETFDVDHTTNWTVNAGPSDNAADLFFDYSTVGIPSAPHSGGTTRGLKLESNISASTFGGISVSPTGLHVPGDIVVTFDIWWNFVGPAPAGGSGSTQLTGAGFGTAGTNAMWAGAVGDIDSVTMLVTGDGGSAADYRLYSTAATTSYAGGAPEYAAPGGDRNGSNAYYASLGSNTPPAAQTLLYAQQTGTTQSGAPAFRWHAGRITRYGNDLTFTIDGLRIGTVDLSTVSLGGDNILFSQSDINSSSSTDVNKRALQFGLIDNVVVAQLTEPVLTALSVTGAVGNVTVASTAAVPRATYWLEQNSDLMTTNWDAIVSEEANDAGNVSFSTVTTNAPTYFRLRQEP